MEQMKAIQEQQEEVFRQQEKKKNEQELKRFIHGTAMKLKNQKLNQLADNHKKGLQKSFQQKLENLRAQIGQIEKKTEVDEFGVLIPSKPADPGILQTIHILIPTQEFAPWKSLSHQGVVDKSFSSYSTSNTLMYVELCRGLWRQAFAGASSAN